MKLGIIFSILFFSACSLKQSSIIDVNLKMQTLMFTQKHRISQDDINAIITMSYLNPVLDQPCQNDILALTLTPNTLKVDKLEVFMNSRRAKIEALHQDFLKYLIKNDYTKYLKISLPSLKNEDKILVRLCLNHLPCFELNFQKYPKSLYYRSEDIDIQYN